MFIEKRSVGTCILLSIVTCGIYYWYWFYKMADDIYRINGEESKAGMDLVLSIVTCGIYFIYCMYNYGRKLALARTRYDLPYKDESSLFLVLGILNYFIGVTGYVAFAIMQSNLNEEFANNAPGNFN